MIDLHKLNALIEQNMRAMQIKSYQVVPAQWRLPSLFWLYFIPSPQVNIIEHYYNKYYGFPWVLRLYSLLWSNGAYKLAVNYSVKHWVRLSNGVGYEWHRCLVLIRCVTGEFPAQRPVTGSSDVVFDLRLNERLSKHSWAGDLRPHLAHYDVTVM